MKIFINNTLTELPSEVRNIADLVKWKKLPEASTAVAADNRLVLRKNWQLREIADGEHITLISAAFGG